MKIPAASSSGKYPPSGIFTAFAAQNERSTIRNRTVAPTERAMPHLARFRMACHAIRLVITIVVDTAIPYMAARLLDERNWSTRNTVITNNAQFTKGI